MTQELSRIKLVRLEQKRLEYVGKIYGSCEITEILRMPEYYSVIIKCHECGGVSRLELNKFLSNPICPISHNTSNTQVSTKKTKFVTPKRFKNLSGQKIGRFTVLEHIGWHKPPKGRPVAKYKCVCKCGEPCELTASVLKAGRKLCDKEFQQHKIEQGKRSAKKRIKDKIENGEYKEPSYRDRISRKLSKFSRLVYDRFNGVCQKCKNTFPKQNTASHHIIPINTKPELALTLSNGILLCKNCHDNFHMIYGRIDFDHLQIFNYIKSTEVTQYDRYSNSSENERLG